MGIAYSAMLCPLLDKAQYRPGQNLEGAEEVEDCIGGRDSIGRSNKFWKSVRISYDDFDLVLDAQRQY